MKKRIHIPLQFELKTLVGIATLSFFHISLHAKNEEIWGLSIEELLNTPIISVSKKEQHLLDIPASISVIQSDRIDSKAELFIPDMLRTIPGLAVAQNNAGNWSVTSRGFGGRFTNKLLVMADGRNLYNPGYSGTFWFAQNMNPNDIDRIEIIRGPGGTHWGANAMNGIINIITKSSFDTIGNQIISAYGNQLDHYFSMRFGDKVSENTAFRVSTNFVSNSGNADEFDGFNERRIDFRLDSKQDNDLTFTLQSGYSKAQLKDGYLIPDFISKKNQSVIKNTDLESFNVLGKMVKEWDNTAFTVKSYIQQDNTKSLHVDYHLDIYDIELNLQHSPNEKHDLMLGAGARYSRMDTTQNYQDHVFNFFIQDEISLTERNTLSIGSKVEYFSNNIGVCYEPSIKLLHKWSKNNVTWLSISNAIRAPSIGEREVTTGVINASMTETYQGPLFMYAQVESNPNDVQIEKMTSFEIGQRMNWNQNTMVNISFFRSIYEDQIRVDYQNSEIVPTDPIPTISHTFYVTNTNDPVTTGGELSIDHIINHKMSVSFNYSYINIDLKDSYQIAKDPSGLVAQASTNYERNTPGHQANLMFNIDLHDNFRAMFNLRYVDEIVAARDTIPAYTELDLSFNWFINDQLKLSIAGQNLLDSKHQEFDMSFDLQTIHTDVERSIFCKLEYNF